ncbi:hypothetical protein EJD97_022780 [Solanum chilense]|uniref:Uncharacterized protein n=1 Tax=Solanum chilense TaxID=4083 RepID=A0A6N2AT19_SOLCI|nr:hypothetical protein EJD97_022780 [Solanum chilense]
MISNDGFHPSPCSSPRSGGHCRFFKNLNGSGKSAFNFFPYPYILLGGTYGFRLTIVTLFPSPSALHRGVESFCSTAVIFSPSPTILSREAEE